MAFLERARASPRVGTGRSQRWRSPIGTLNTLGGSTRKRVSAQALPARKSRRHDSKRASALKEASAANVIGTSVCVYVAVYSMYVGCIHSGVYTFLACFRALEPFKGHAGRNVNVKASFLPLVYAF